MIVGKKVGLRAVEEGDLPLLRDWRNIESFRRNFREHRELNMANQRAWFEKAVVGNPNDYMFTIVELADGAPIGACGLLYINWIIRSGDFSFYIGKNQKYIDQEGLAAEATKLLIEYGFKVLNLNKIWMELFEFDTKKFDFFTKQFSFKLDGVLRQNCYHDGKYWDSRIISLLRTDYE